MHKHHHVIHSMSLGGLHHHWTGGQVSLLMFMLILVVIFVAFKLATR